MISALIIARVLCDLAVSNKGVSRKPAISGLGNVGKVRTWLDRKDPDIMKNRGRWLAVSGAATIFAIAGIAVQGLNLGVEFTGGRQLDYAVSQDITVEQARAAVSDAGFSEAVVQTADTPADFTVRTGEINNDEEQRIEDELSAIGGDVSKIDDQLIGASLGEELRNNALIAFGVAFLAQLLYLAFRFKWTFGVSAVIAMAHDVLIVVGIFAWLEKPIDGIFLAAAMTIIGLSVNDTVVVFDRVRERWHGSKPEDDFKTLANKAAVETVPAHGQHRSRHDVHPRCARDPRRRLAARLLDRAAHRSDRRHLLLGLHRHPARDLLPGEVADEPGEEGEGRARSRGLGRGRLSGRSSPPGDRARRRLITCSGSC